MPDPLHRRILIASPIEPSGASWLLNCFLELGIRIDHKPIVDRVWRGSNPPPPPDRMWIPTHDNRVALNPKARELMKFLPALTRQADFQFRADVSVEYVQDLPLRQLDERPVDQRGRVLVVRDPRDALYSSYRRSSPTLAFADYLNFPNPGTLLNRSAHWTLFVAAWLAMPDIHVVRFEDYKRDAEATLRSALAALNQTFPDGDIAKAVRLSSFEAARDAERALGSQFAHDGQVANRSGKVGEAYDHPEVSNSIPWIEAEAAPVLRELGYDAPAPAPRDPFTAARLSAAFLSRFEIVRLPASICSVPMDIAASQDALFAVLAFAHRLDSDLLHRASVPPAEARTLLDSLTEFARRYAEWLANHLEPTRSTFGDGSGYFFQRIKTMRQSAKPWPAAHAAANGEAR